MKPSRSFAIASRTFSATVFAALVAGTTPAGAQETVRLTFLSGFPPPATFVGAFVDAYVPAVDAHLAQSGTYKIDWNLAHSGQVVKPRGELEGVQAGLGDISSVVTAFHLDRVPLYKVPYVTPFTTKDPGLVSAAYIDLQEQYPQFGDTWRRLGQVQIGTTTVVDNYVLASRSPIASLSDLRGLKVGAAGANLPWIEGAGASGVTADLASFYHGASSGLYNAVLLWPQPLGSFKLCEPAPHVLDADIGAASVHGLNVNEKVWEGLPDEVKEALINAADAWNAEQIERLREGTEAALELCRREYGMTYTRMDPEDRVEWAKSLPNLAQSWALEVEKDGLPGRAILATYMDRMRAADQPIARNWDRE